MSSVPVGRSEVRQFVAQVRAALDDLSTDEIEELTGGLEADLDDALRDAGGDPGGGDGGTLGGQAGPVAGLGDPTRYAEELRAAAGLPARAGGGDRLGGVVAVLREVRKGRDAVLARLRSRRWWPAAQEHAAAARPFWWVARAWIAFQILHAGTHQAGGYGDVLPLSPLAWLVFLALVAGSVELGRLTRAAHRRAATDVGRGGPGSRREWAVRLLLFANVLAVLAIPVSLAHARKSEQYYAAQQGPVMPPQDGLWHNGTEIRNVFAYDSRGNPLTGVQLYDENGNPVDVGTSARTPLTDAEGNIVAQVPVVDHDGSQRWNVFPLRQQVIPPYVDPAPGADRTTPYLPPWPTPAIPPALVPTGSSSPPTAMWTPIPTRTGTPTSTTTPTQTITPTP
jgi:hypothetical protein